MKHLLFCLFIILCTTVEAQQLKLKPRKANALGGTAFAQSIADSNLSLVQRETLIFKAIKKGNIPDFLRTFQVIEDSIVLTPDHVLKIKYNVLPDYFAIGSNDDYFYVPMTPILAQRVATLFNCSLPTKKMVDQIYKQAELKLEPKPLPPTKAMTTVPVFLAHNQMIKAQLMADSNAHQQGVLIAGHKKDVIISNKIYGEQSPRVVIYGWHQLNGKPIQPVYNKHTHTWADYSHGIRLVQNKCWVNGKKTPLKKILAHKEWSRLLSEEGPIAMPYYPLYKTY